MAKNELTQEAMAHVIELPVYLKDARTKHSMKVLKIGETLKMIARDKALSYDKVEFEREFGDLNKFKPALSGYLKKFHLRGRIVEDEGKVILFANDLLKRGG